MSEKEFRELKIDAELRDLLPPLTEDEYNQLEENIKKDGCRDAIITWNGYIVDGHNRYGICKKYGYGFYEIPLMYDTKDEVIQWIINNQMGRRNLSPLERIKVILKYKYIFVKQAKINQGNRGNKVPNPVDTSKILAKMACVGQQLFWRGEKILNSNNEEIIEKVKNGDISINKAYNDIFSNKPKQRKPISNIIIKHLTLRSQGKCEICEWGGQGLEGVLLPHHIHKYSESQDNSCDNLIMICPNCHGIIHTLENCNDISIKQTIFNSLDMELANNISTYLNKLK